jgi:Helix-turn-helix of insertion element transposase
MENNDKKEQTIGVRQSEQKKTLIQTFKQMPIIEIACRKCGINRSTYYRWQEDDKDFREEAVYAMSEGEEFISDKTEVQLISLAGEKSLGAIKYWLSHHRSKYQKESRDGDSEQKIRVILVHDKHD